jgi:predicted transcriptional regulator
MPVPRPGSEILSQREAQLMEVLWRHGEATAELVRAELPERLHDSTVRTLLRTLETKGYARHEERGKSYVYRAVRGRDQVQRTAVRTLLSRLFGGSAEDLVLRMLEDEQLSPEQLADIRRSHAPRKRRRKEGGSP